LSFVLKQEANFQIWKRSIDAFKTEKFPKHWPNQNNQPKISFDQKQYFALRKKKKKEQFGFK
jgi:hypothetical protein